MTRTLFTEDRRNGMLGLIFLTGISPTELFFGRLGGAALVALQKLLALVPLLSIPFLMGGVSYDVFLGTAAALPVLFVFVLSVCVLASILGTDAASSRLLALLIGGVVCAATPAYYHADQLFADGPSTAGPALLILSPAYGPYLLQNQLSTATPLDLWANFTVTLGWSAAFFSMAGWILKRSWQERVPNARWLRWREQWQRFVHGSKSWRQRAAGWLEDNPFLWLAAHDRQPVTLTWAVVGLIFGAWMGLWWLWPAGWPSVLNFFLTALLLNCSVGAMSGYTTAKRLSEDRRSGALEILLTTPLTAEQIVEGQLRASEIQFRSICRVVFLLNLLMLVGGLCTRDWNIRALLVYGVCWSFLLLHARGLGGVNYRLKALWAGLNSGQASYAIKAELSALGAGSIYWIFNARQLFGFLSKFPTGSVPEAAIVIFVGVLVGLILSFREDEFSLRVRLVNELRSISEEPVPEPNDPRFKGWNLTKRLGEEN